MFKFKFAVINLLAMALAFSACSSGGGNSDGEDDAITHPDTLTLTISSSEPDPTSAAAIPVTFTFNDDVTGFKAGDVTVTNGSLINFTAESSAVYRAVIEPDEEGAVMVSVAADTAQNSINNGNPSAGFTIAYNTVVIVKTHISGISATTSAITLAWTDPLDINFDHVEITCEYDTNSETGTVAAGTGTFTLSSINGTPLSQDTLYKITVKNVSSTGGLSEAVVLLIKTSPSGSIEYTVISTADELYAIRYGGLSGNYLLTADIDLAGYSWRPIAVGNSAVFRGIFNGNGHRISNLTRNTPVYYQGLFGYIDGGIVCGLGLVNVNISGGASYVGALAGKVSGGGIISDCYATGSVSGIDYVGGLIGFNGASSSISNCHVSCAVLGSQDADYGGVGGLVGYNDTGTISDCHATGAVSQPVNHTAIYGCGGLVGYNYEGVIKNCHATGAVSGSSRIGGLVGYSYKDSTILNCYATGAVSGDESYIGGLVGYNYRNSTILNCYATGPVSGDDNYIGGLVGHCSEGAISNCYAKGAVSGDEMVGGLLGATVQFYFIKLLCHRRSKRFTLYRRADWRFL